MEKKKKILLGISITILIYLAFRFLLPIVLPFVIAGIVSVIYYPFLRKVYRNSDIWNSGKKKWILALSVILFYVVILLLVCWLGGYLFRQGQSIWLNFPFYQAKAVCFLKNCCCELDTVFRMEDGASFTYVETMVDKVNGDMLSSFLPKVTTYSVQMASRIFGIVFEIVITVMATFFMIQDYEQIRRKLLQSEWGKNVCRVITKCKETLKTYIRAQGLIMLLDGTICIIAFLIIRQPYAWILGPLTALIDALPVLGAGLILWPGMLILLLTGTFWKAAVLLLAYLGCLLVRQVTEPRMIGNKVGMRPLYTIMSMYIGFRLFGVFGFLLGPVGVLIGREIYKSIVLLENKKE